MKYTPPPPSDHAFPSMSSISVSFPSPFICPSSLASSLHHRTYGKPAEVGWRGEREVQYTQNARIPRGKSGKPRREAGEGRRSSNGGGLDLLWYLWIWTGVKFFFAEVDLPLIRLRMT